MLALPSKGIEIGVLIFLSTYSERVIEKAKNLLKMERLEGVKLFLVNSN
jgi:hypothetical protein